MENLEEKYIAALKKEAREKWYKWNEGKEKERRSKLEVVGYILMVLAVFAAVVGPFVAVSAIENRYMVGEYRIVGSLVVIKSAYGPPVINGAGPYEYELLNPRPEYLDMLFWVTLGLILFAGFAFTFCAIVAVLETIHKRNQFIESYVFKKLREEV